VGLRLAFEEGSSKYFPASNSAKEVRDLLLAACTRQGATFRFSYFPFTAGSHPSSEVLQSGGLAPRGEGGEMMQQFALLTKRFISGECEWQRPSRLSLVAGMAPDWKS